jgi:hypothetical protein
MNFSTLALNQKWAIGSSFLGDFHSSFRHYFLEELLQFRSTMSSFLVPNRITNKIPNLKHRIDSSFTPPYMAQIPPLGL